MDVNSDLHRRSAVLSCYSFVILWSWWQAELVQAAVHIYAYTQFYNEGVLLGYTGRAIVMRCRDEDLNPGPQGSGKSPLYH